MIFYTGAVQNGAVQDNPAKSLGGWISSSPVPNGAMNNLFGDLTYADLDKDKKPIRVIAFQNITGAVIPKLRIWVEHEADAYATYKIGLSISTVEPTCNLNYFEQLATQYSIPYYTTLKDCEGELNAIEIENIPAGQYLGLFIQRNVIKANNPEIEQKNKGCQAYADDFAATQVLGYEEPEVRVEDNINIIITDEEPVI